MKLSLSLNNDALLTYWPTEDVNKVRVTAPVPSIYITYHFRVGFVQSQSHERMGHGGMGTMVQSISGDDPTWFNSRVTADEVKAVIKNNVCPIVSLPRKFSTHP